MAGEPIPLDIQLTLTLILSTPLCVGDAGSRDGLADKSFQRNGWDFPIIPGSQLKGKVRHSCERIARALGCSLCEAPRGTMCPDNATIARTATESFHLQQARQHGAENARQCVLCALFGSPVYPSPLVFKNLVATSTSEGRLRIGVGIDRQRRTALEQVLYAVETTEAGLVLTGTIVGRWWNTPVEEVRPLLGLLLAGARLTTRWGGASSRGLGWATVESQIELNGREEQPQTLIQEVAALCPTVS